MCVKLSGSYHQIGKDTILTLKKASESGDGIDSSEIESIEQAAKKDNNFTKDEQKLIDRLKQETKDNKVIKNLKFSDIDPKSPALDFDLKFAKNSINIVPAKLKKGDKWDNGTIISTNVRTTGYSPINKGVEGGKLDNSYDHEKGDKDPAYKDKHLLKTLQDFLAGKASYVSIALDPGVYGKKIKNGEVFRIPELEEQLGKKPIYFKAHDSGGDGFKGEGLGHIDICVNPSNRKDGLVNGRITLVKLPKEDVPDSVKNK
jgi:hypothetical protein